MELSTAVLPRRHRHVGRAERCIRVILFDSPMAACYHFDVARILLFSLLHPFLSENREKMGPETRGVFWQATLSLVGKPLPFALFLGQSGGQGQKAEGSGRIRLKDMMQANLVNGWREVLARIFDGFVAEYGLTPDWLINPETNRRLKLDCFFPEIALAVRFVGLEATARKQRKSDEEVLAEEARERARAAVCREHGVTLISIDPDDEPRHALRSIEMGLARASSQLAQSKTIPHAEKQRLMPLLAHARRRTGEFVVRLTVPEKLNIYAEMWWDRQANLAAQAPARPAPAALPRFEVGMEVFHERFGPGQVTEVVPEDGDIKVTVSFVEAGVRSFYASLVAGKLTPRA